VTDEAPNSNTWCVTYYVKDDNAEYTEFVRCPTEYEAVQTVIARNRLREKDIRGVTVRA
jgi:hypothetical protein